MMQYIIGFILVFFVSFFLTGIIRRCVIAQNILDIPNDRSSHTIPMPRGGGASFMFLFSIITIYLAWNHMISLSLFYALNGGIIIAIIGWFDDVISVKPRWRILVHTIAATWAVYWIGGVPGLPMSLLSYLIAVVSIIWCINLYNFMDGIDGLAGMEGLFISLCTAFILGEMGMTGFSQLCLLLSATIAGFLVWNWPPAKIFMGDVGSGYLGYIFSVIVITTANMNILPITYWIIISAVFLCDATFTVIDRIYKGKHWYHAHKDHAYQKLITYGMSHRAITLSILFINVCILLPLTIIIFYLPYWQNIITLLGLCVFYIFWKMITITDTRN